MSKSKYAIPVRLRIVLCLLSLAACLSPTQALPEEVPLVDREEVVRWTFTERWRRGTNEDDLFFGMVVSACQGPDGHLYLLDAQRNQVSVVSWQGELLRTLGREGDGPGEFRRPVALVFLDDESLGVVQRIPGKIICLDLNGIPQGAIGAGSQTADHDGGFRLLTGAQSRGGTRVFCGEENRGGQMMQFLSVVDAEGHELHRLLARPRERIFETRYFVERKEDFVASGRWRVGPDGRIYTAPQRDRYVVMIHGSQGELLGTIERPCVARRRTGAEIEEMKDAIVMMVDGRRVRIDSEIEATAPCIEQLRVTDEGELWVLTSQGAHDPPDGIFQVWDVFAADGKLVHHLELNVPGNPQTDRLVLLPGERAVLLKGFVQAGRASRPGLVGEEVREVPDDAAHFVIGLEREQ